MMKSKLKTESHLCIDVRAIGRQEEGRHHQAQGIPILPISKFGALCAVNEGRIRQAVILDHTNSQISICLILHVTIAMI